MVRNCKPPPKRHAIQLEHEPVAQLGRAPATRYAGLLPILLEESRWSRVRVEEKTRKSRRGRHSVFTMVSYVRISLFLLVLLDNFIFCLLEFLVEFFMESIFRVKSRIIGDLEKLERLLLDANVVGKVLKMKSHEVFMPNRALNIGEFEFERIKSNPIGDNIVVVRRGKVKGRGAYWKYRIFTAIKLPYNYEIYSMLIEDCFHIVTKFLEGGKLGKILKLRGKVIGYFEDDRFENEKKAFFAYRRKGLEGYVVEGVDIQVILLVE